MTGMHSRQAILELLHTVLESETNTLYLYEDYLNRIDDIEIRDVFKRLRDEEARHAESVKELLKRIQNPPMKA
jgi:rubrerythrin